ncbi:hypothetical protein [Nitritalea halalkaliphila]|nr:hypothetical protein [Nitritalea halalkaliphila]
MVRVEIDLSGDLEQMLNVSIGDLRTSNRTQTVNVGAEIIFPVNTNWTFVAENIHSFTIVDPTIDRIVIQSLEPATRVGIALLCFTFNLPEDQEFLRANVKVFGDNVLIEEFSFTANQIGENILSKEIIF